MSFKKVARLDDLEEGLGTSVEIDGHPICLVRMGDDVKAVYDVCSHEEYPLHEGFTFGHSLECALHGSTFDLDTGEAQNLPATQPVPVFTTKLDGADVYVDLDQQLNDAPLPEHD